MYSRFAWGFLVKKKVGVKKIKKKIAEPKNKIWNNITDPLVFLIEKQTQPNTLRNLNSDGESVWKSNVMKKFYKDKKSIHDIAEPSVLGAMKSHHRQGISERFNRTLRSLYNNYWDTEEALVEAGIKNQRNAISEGNFAFIQNNNPILQDEPKKGETLLQFLLEKYNSKIHSTTKKKPIDVLTSFQPEKRKINVLQGQTNKFLKGSNYTQRQRMPKLKIGAHVRIYEGLPKFDKKGKIIPNAKADFNWSKSVYKIVGKKTERN